MKQSSGKILIHTDGSRSDGLGHIYRAIYLARELKNRGWDTSLWVKNKRWLINVVNKADVDIYFAAQCDDKLGCLKFIAPDILITDLPPKYNSTAISAAAKKEKFFYVAIDDMWLGEQEADLCINPSIVKSKKKSDCHFSGHKYMVINNNLNKMALSGREINSKVKNILISMGGSDPGGITYTVLSALDSNGVMCKSIHTNVVIGRKSMISLNYINKNHVNLVHSPESLHNLMAEADIGFFAGGITLYEAAALGLPSIVIGQNRFQENTAKEFHSKGATQYLGLFSNTLKEDIYSTYTALSLNYEKRAIMSKAGKTLIDTKGTSRVIDLIEYKYKEFRKNYF